MKYLLRYYIAISLRMYDSISIFVLDLGVIQHQWVINSGTIGGAFLQGVLIMFCRATIFGMLIMFACVTQVIDWQAAQHSGWPIIHALSKWESLFVWHWLFIPIFKLIDFVPLEQHFVLLLVLLGAVVPELCEGQLHTAVFCVEGHFNGLLFIGRCYI
jgi:hypothetical protein